MTTLQSARLVVSAEEWLRARKNLLEEEKALTRQREELSRKRRQLPWVRVENNYEFEGPDGAITLSALFHGRAQLMIYHFMFGPDWVEGCPSCSLVADNIAGALPHLEQRDTSLAMVSRAPIGKLEAFRKRMGWAVPWVSSFSNSFNRDYHVSFSKDEIERGGGYYNFEPSQFPIDEAPGLSVFYKDDAGTIFHTYSTYARGLEPLVSTYDLLDMTPKGRDEDSLPFPMAWVRHHDRYVAAKKIPFSGSCCHSD